MKNFPNLVKEIDIQVQESQSPKQDGCKGTTPRCIIIKMPKIKDKERILKTAREKQSYLQRSSHKRADFSKETLQARRVWQEVLKVKKNKAYSLDYSIQQSYHLEWKSR